MVHMAVLLNELFYPKADAHAAALFAAAAFCSTYLLRPFGALIFGWIGDNIGRKSTVVITTALMSISCVCYGYFSYLRSNWCKCCMDDNNLSYHSRYFLNGGSNRG